MSPAPFMTESRRFSSVKPL